MSLHLPPLCFFDHANPSHSRIRRNLPKLHIPAAVRGVSLIELLVVLMIAAVLITALGSVVGTALQSQAAVGDRNDLTREARFALGRMVQAVQHSPLLILPLRDNPATGNDESVRDVLAVTLDHVQDLDGNGTADADNDGDGQIDEDLPADVNNDGKPGIRGIDDDGNGITDFSMAPTGDDDESNDLSQGEDPINGVDDDADGSIDEDPDADMNGDGCSGICGVDDDGDASVDEATADNDDEDDQTDEDWYDTVVFFLNTGTLMQRIPVPWDENSDSSITGLDYIESTIAENVSLLRVKRVSQAGNRAQLVDITLELTSPETGKGVSLNTQVRVGGAL